MKRAALVALVVVFAVALAAAQKPSKNKGGKADPRVEKQLKALELKYEVDKDGDYRLIYEVGEERSQVVFVNSVTNTVREIEVREIWSPALVGEEPPGADVMKKVLDDSQQRTIGGWQLMSGDKSYVLNYAVKIPVDSTDKLLSAAAIVAAHTADALEKDVTGKDDL
ncbi:MAG: hypothetical protein HYU66_09920 [Armatimonadetes bacterium]|nr:hypothetical protein [Armatimonadota bacterium]